MLKGINQWCFPEGTPLERVFATCAAAGIESVELNVAEAGVGAVGLTLDSTPGEVAAIASLAGQYGLALRSLSSGLTGKYALTSADESVRAQGGEAIRGMLRIANLLGIDTLLVVPGRVTERDAYDECYRRSQHELAGLLPEAEAAGVSLALENIWNRFLLSPLEFGRFIDELDSPAVGAYFDVGNVMLYGYPEQWIRVLGRRIRRVHVKDFRVSVGYYDGFVPLLSGDVNWAAVRNALREIGYGDTVTAELTAYKSDPDRLIFDTSAQLDWILGRNEEGGGAEREAIG